MRADETPWPLLFDKLRRGETRVSYAEVEEHGADAALMVREDVLEYGKSDGYEPPGCEHACTPRLDWETKRNERLVGVACPREPACWTGWTWVRQEEVDSLWCPTPKVLSAAAARNGLAPLSTRVELPFVGVGMLVRRGMQVPVVWLRRLGVGFDQLVRGLRAQIGGDALIVLVPKRPTTEFYPRERIAVLELPASIDGDLGLIRALDMLAPDYRALAASREHYELDLDWIHLRFATSADRHHLLINGHDFNGFRKADVLFAQLLYLAAIRKEDRLQGRLRKNALVADFAKRPDDATTPLADKALERLREELAKDEVYGLGETDLDALIKTERGAGMVRLGVPPENIVFDASLAELAWKTPDTATSKKGRAKLAGTQLTGLQRAQLLLNEARRHGVPGGLMASRSSKA